MKFKNTLYFVLLAIIVSSCNTNEAIQVSPKHKNILFIVVDDLKPEIGCYGDTLIKTPNIDKLASQGFVMENNHCQQAICGPTRASLLTGKRPDYTKVYDLKTQIRDINPNIVTIPQYFKSKGYQTAGVGKVFDLRTVDALNDSISWTYKYQYVKGSSIVGGGYVYETKRVTTEAPVVADSLTMDGDVVRQSNAYLNKFAKDDKPFFLAVGFYKPHLPFVAPKRYWDLYPEETIKLAEFREHSKNAPDYAFQPGWEIKSQYEDTPNDFDVDIPDEQQKNLIRGYYACVSFIDQQIGNVIDELDKLGLRENTVIVLWGDHGWHLGDHNMWCKHTNFEQATRSPLIFSAGKDLVGSTKSPTEFIDVFPTLCELSGVETPNNLDGVSLKPILDSSKDKLMNVAVSQFPRFPDKMGYSFRNERYRYTIWMKDNWKSTDVFDDKFIDAEELYDYEVDPLEKVSVANDKAYADVKAKMYAEAIKFFKSHETKLK
jgi:arylsulfatase A-like enzyme